MKRMILFLFIAAAVLLLSTVGAQAQDVDKYVTGMTFNGRWLSDAPNDIGELYMAGVIDCLSGIRDDIFTAHYSGCTRGDIFMAVRAYYRDNPTKRHVPIVAVIISGCEYE